MPTHFKRRSAAASEKCALRWPAIFRRRLVQVDPPEIGETWRRFLESDGGDADARHELFDFYAPLVSRVACAMKRSRPEFYRDDVIDLLNDGALGLLRRIDSAADYQPIYFRFEAKRVIRKTIRREVLKRLGLSRRHVEKMNVVARARSLFVQDHGRMPERDELSAQLAPMFTNPQIQIDHLRPTITAVGDAADPERASDALTCAPSRDDAPDARMMDRETVQLALKHLRGDDRRILKMLLAGRGPSDIGREMGIAESTARLRLNGVLWEARRRADLASHLGVEPIETPRPARMFGARRGGRNVPPQVAALGLSSLPTTKLSREDRTDHEIISLLRAGYSGRAMVEATRGQTKRVKARVATLQRSLMAEIRAATALAG
ncbi:MAG: hypothetical protein QOF78_595 [Phycisphaerales bacterium]|jgi:RNA polymerase sigma factor (sigma-70 family)|nr:hypothetical protein [Phycisphaerales bacterium]